MDGKVGTWKGGAGGMQRVWAVAWPQGIDGMGFSFFSPSFALDACVFSISDFSFSFQQLLLEMQIET